MSFTQHVKPCDHEECPLGGADCTQIYCTRDEDGVEVWRSHGHELIHERRNPHYPLIDADGTRHEAVAEADLRDEARR